MRYLYLPFSNYMADSSYTGTVDRYKRKGHKIIEHSFGWKPLRVLKATDVLIIMGHGGSGSNRRGLNSVKRVEKERKVRYAKQTLKDLAAQPGRERVPTS